MRSSRILDAYRPLQWPSLLPHMTPLIKHTPCHAHRPATHAPPFMPTATHAPPCHECPRTTHIPPVTHAPPMDRMTDACENITFSQLLLQTVKMVSKPRWIPILHASLPTCDGFRRFTTGVTHVLAHTCTNIRGTRTRD